MLHIYYGDMPEAVFNTAVYFKNVYEDAWIDDPFSKEMILDVDNCAKWILEIGKQQDITINLRHIMDFGEGEFEIEILNTEQIVHNMEELVRFAGLYV